MPGFKLSDLAFDLKADRFSYRFDGIDIAAEGRHQLAVIPDGQMLTLQNMLSQEDAEVVFATTGFTVGDEVRVLGWGDNIIGHVVRIRGEKGSYIGLRIDQLGCAYMEISPNRIVKNTRKS